MDGQSRLKHSGERSSFQTADQEGKGETIEENKTEGLHPRLDLPSFNAHPHPQSMELEVVFCWPL